MTPKRSKAKPRSGPSLQRMREALARRSKAVGGEDVDHGVGIIDAILDAGAAQGQPPDAVSGYLASGAAAFRAGAFDHETQAGKADGPLAQAACRSGCAFCCVFPGKDGGLITEYEARMLHAALAPLAGAPDGRLWRAEACPSLDPETLQCRAYEARPLICRAYFSTDVEACKAALDGEERGGTAVLTAYPRYLAIMALVRQMLGIANAPSYSLVRVAAAAVDGKSVTAALKAAKHAPSVLNGERERVRRAGGG